MTDPAHPGRMLFVNVPVADLERSKAFFAELGFGYGPAFTDETAACMPVGEHAFVMLLTREEFAEFSKLPIADPTTHAPRTTASCTRGASSTSTATAGRSCGWTRRQRSRAPRRSRPPCRTPTPRPDPPPRSARASSWGTGSSEPLRPVVVVAGLVRTHDRDRC